MNLGSVGRFLGLCFDVGDGWGGSWFDTGWGDWGGLLGVEEGVVVDLYPDTWLVRRPHLVVMLLECIAGILDPILYSMRRSRGLNRVG